METQEGRGQHTTFKRMTAFEDTTKLVRIHQIQDGIRPDSQKTLSLVIHPLY